MSCSIRPSSRGLQALNLGAKLRTNVERVSYLCFQLLLTFCRLGSRAAVNPSQARLQPIVHSRL